MHTATSFRIFAATAATVALLALNACSKPADTTAVPSPAAAGCNRQCLIGVTDTYVAALVAHDPSKAPLSDKITFVENVTKLQPGEGLWKSIVKGPSTFAIHVPDEVNQSAGYLAMVTFMGPAQAPQGSSPEQRAEFARNNPPLEQPAIIAIRLKLDANGKIEQAEHLLSGVREPQMVNLQSPRAGIFAEVPATQRKSHDELIRIGASYYDALDDNNGELSPFAADCERHENGMITASSQPSPAPAIPGAAAQPKVARSPPIRFSTSTESRIAGSLRRTRNRASSWVSPISGIR
jgi:hypothetical protein